MGALRVNAPDGRHWTVRRQWAPRLAGRGLRARVDRARRGDRDRTGWLDLLELPRWADAGSPALAYGRVPDQEEQPPTAGRRPPRGGGTRS